MLKKLLLIAAAMCLCTGFLKDISGNKALDAGLDAVKAVTISDDEIKQMGKESAAALDQLNPVAPDSDPNAKRLEKIIGKLTKEDGLTLNYKLYKVVDVNAFALPDGSIRVCEGLMKVMTDDEIFFVIGHEIGHVKNGDSADAMKVELASSAARKGAGAAGGIAGTLSQSQLGDLGEKVVNAQFSQSQESAADRYGMGLLKKYKKDTAAGPSALRKLGSGPSGAMEKFLSSHPDSEKRAAALEKLR